MHLKGLFKDSPILFQLIILLFLVLIGSFISNLAGIAIAYLIHGPDCILLEHPDMIRWMQLLAAIGTFLFPAFTLAWLCSLDVKQYLSIGPVPTSKTVLLSFVGLLLLSPVINLTGYLNSLLTFPEFLAPVERWMSEQEDNAQKMTEMLLADKTPLTFLFNFLVIALVAAITEEFLFRGALQKIMGGFSPNPHIVIWGTAIIFSTFHLQFYSFIPRVILGAYMGYLLYWGRNIWVPILIHLINNSIAIIGMSSHNLKENEFFTGELSEGQLLPYFFVTLVASSIFFILITHLRKILLNKKEPQPEL